LGAVAQELAPPETPDAVGAATDQAEEMADKARGTADELAGGTVDEIGGQAAPLGLDRVVSILRGRVTSAEAPRRLAVALLFVARRRLRR
jgi:hypothetical protein